jgi:hypothetical protein
MLKSYAAIYKHGHLNWLDDVPQQENVQVIVTFIETPAKKQLRQAQKILQQAWGCVKKPYTIAQIDADIAKMRSEWE